MRPVQLGLRLLAREWRSGELGVLLLALAVAVAALSGVGLLVDRVNRAMLLQASEVLGADLRLQSPRPIDARYAQQAQADGLQSSATTALLSVVLRGDATQLANVYAVAAGYPLRGTVRISDQAFGEPQDTHTLPAAGEVWPDSRLLAALGANVGDSLSVGAASLRVTRVLVSRPDQGSGFVELAPTLLMNQTDLPATELLQPGSRASQAALFAGTPQQTQAFSKWLAANKQDAERLRDLREASPEVGNAATRATRFLLLASLASVLLSAVAVAMSARRYVQRHLDVVALLKTLGASSRFALALSASQLLAIALLATVLGSIVGYLAQNGLLRALQGLITTDLPPPGSGPLFMGLVAAVLLLAGFALPPVVQLSKVPAIRILRRDMTAPKAAAWLGSGPAMLSVLLLVLWVTGELPLALWFSASLAAVVMVLGGAALLLVQGVGSLRGRAGVAWRYGLANLARRRVSSVVQVIAFGLGLTALLMLAVIRGDLINSWRDSLPASAPNYFFVNIPPDQRQAFADYISADQGEITRLLPMIRGRMTAINDQAVAQMHFAGARGEAFAQREQNLSWSDQLGAGNRVTSGRWFDAADNGKPVVSVAVDFQESLGLKLGDKLRFDIGGETYEAAIIGFRAIKWDSLQPNFFLMFPPGLLDNAAGTYMTSARYRPTQSSTIAQLVRRFPSVSIFDMDDLLGQLRAMIDKAVLAVQSVFVFTLFSGLTVLLAAVQASRDERRYESAMLRTLGAQSSTILAGVLVEFAAIGLLAGVLAASIATLGGYVVASQLLDVPYHPDPLLWLGGVLSAVVLVCLAGYLSTRSALAQSPLGVLRQG